MNRGLDDRVLGLYAGGMSVRDIARHLSELYGTEIGRDTVSRVTDAVLEDIAAWRSRPLAAIYPMEFPRFRGHLTAGPSGLAGRMPVDAEDPAVFVGVPS